MNRMNQDLKTIHDKSRRRIVIKPHKTGAALTTPTTPKTTFPKSYNNMESTKIPSFHQLFRSKKDGISQVGKVQNKNFSVISKHDIPC